jgi:hypothetical protein
VDCGEEAGKKVWNQVYDTIALHPISVTLKRIMSTAADGARGTRPSNPFSPSAGSLCLTALRNALVVMWLCGRLPGAHKGQCSPFVQMVLSHDEEPIWAIRADLLFPERMDLPSQDTLPDGLAAGNVFRSDQDSPEHRFRGSGRAE